MPSDIIQNRTHFCFLCVWEERKCRIRLTLNVGTEVSQPLQAPDETVGASRSPGPAILRVAAYLHAEQPSDAFLEHGRHSVCSFHEFSGSLLHSLTNHDLVLIRYQPPCHHGQDQLLVLSSPVGSPKFQTKVCPGSSAACKTSPSPVTHSLSHKLPKKKEIFF